MILDSSPGAGCLFRAVIPVVYDSDNLNNITNHPKKT
jgi:hypothetical protein